MNKVSRRRFLSTSTKILAAGPLVGAMASTNIGCFNTTKPNILVLMVDQMQTPPEGYGDEEGAVADLKEVLGFRPISENNAYAQYFPGLTRLQKNGIVMRKHFTASAACVPSRAAIMTGQYPSVNGVTQTDGNYKTAEDVPFLDPDGTPTIADWFHAAGYSTHYFGKWHVSEITEEEGLAPWGFEEFQHYPEPHGGTASNLGTYRDVEFTNAICGFLSNKSKAASDQQPWLAVGSLVNPHDISSYPINWMTPPQIPNPGVVDWAPYPPPTSIPAQGEISNEGGMNGTYTVELNPDGFPQENSNLPPTYHETLEDKPDCQRDFALKWGLSQGANINCVLNSPDIKSPMPFQLQDNAEGWSVGYDQFYFYCHYLADLQLRKILQQLDESGLAENTIVVFLSDHGEMTGAHGGMIQKWHSAYEEIVRVPMIFSSPLLNKCPEKLREIHQPTSSIDLAPTLLALAGLNQESLRQTLETEIGIEVKPLAGADLSDHIHGYGVGRIKDADGAPRSGVFFMTNDMITEIGEHPSQQKLVQYGAFMQSVQACINNGIDIAPGPVCQPNNVRAFCTGDWKIVHYVDPNGVEADQWELYCLELDPIESINLVDYQTGILRTDVTLEGLSQTVLEYRYRLLKEALAEQEAKIIGVA